jgi:hypothetical protein
MRVITDKYASLSLVQRMYESIDTLRGSVQSRTAVLSGRQLAIAANGDISETL